MTGLNIEERRAVSVTLRRFAQQWADKPVPLPKQCPIHPGEPEFDQSWIARLVQVRVPLKVLGAAVLADSPEIFRHHLHRSVRVLRARGIPLLRLHEMLDRLVKILPHELSDTSHRLLSGLATAGHTWIDEARDTWPSPYVTPQSPRQYHFLQAILAGRRPEGMHIVIEALNDGQPVMGICTELFQAGLYEVGRQWEMHQIHLGHEHMATAVAELAFSQLDLRAGPHPDFRPRGQAVVMGAEGESHRFAGQIVASFLEARGWEIRYWGTALPAGTILSSLRQHRPRLLCISLTEPDLLLSLSPLLRQIREDADLKTMRILVGGQAFEDAPDAGRELGADASTTSLQRGLDLLEEWGL